MTWFGPRIEPITSPSPGGCTTSYATDAGKLWAYHRLGFTLKRKGGCSTSEANIKNLSLKKIYSSETLPGSCLNVYVIYCEYMNNG